MNEYLIHKLAGDGDEEKNEGSSRNVNRGLSAAAGALATYLASKHMMGIKDTSTLVGMTAAGGLGGLGLHEMLTGPAKNKEEAAAEKAKHSAEVAEVEARIKNPSILGAPKTEKAVGAYAGAKVADRLTNTLIEAQKATGLPGTPAGPLKPAIGQAINETGRDIIRPIASAKTSYGDLTSGLKALWSLLKLKAPAVGMDIVPKALKLPAEAAGAYYGYNGIEGAQKAVTDYWYGPKEDKKETK